MAHLHLTDSDGVTDTHLLPGDGIMDLRRLMWDLQSTGYDGRATLELVTYYLDDPSAAAEAAICRIKELSEA